MNPQWLTWVKELQAIAQTGLTYTNDPFDKERYAAVRTIAAQIAAYQTDQPLTTILALFTAQTGHTTPKVDVRGVVFQDTQILLVRERSDGRWTLPGGWADINESPSVAVTREVQEEASYATRAVKLLALYDRDKHDHPPHPFHIYKLFFRCDLLNAAPSTHAATDENIEIDGVDFFAPDALPPLSTGRVTAKQIARFFEHAANPTWPTDFD